MRISVALCTYNGEKFLQEQLASIFRQTHPVDEIIICDDGSSDSTLEVIYLFQQKYPGIIHLYVNQTNMGVNNNFSKALGLCTGDIILLADQDDVWMNHKVEKVIDFFCANPDMDGVFSNAALIFDRSEDKSQYTLWELVGFEEIIQKNPAIDLYYYLSLFGNFVSGSCLAIKKKALTYVLPFQKSRLTFHDECIALKLTKVNRMGLIYEDLIYYRLHDDQASRIILQNRDIKRKELLKAIMNDDLDSSPIFYHRFWKHRDKVLDQMLKDGFDISKEAVNTAKRRRKIGLISFLGSYYYLKRKRNLFSLWLRGKEQISFYDILFN